MKKFDDSIWATNAVTPMPRIDIDSLTTNCRDLLARADAERKELDSKVFVFEGTAAEFRRAMESQGVGTGVSSGSMFDMGLEVRESCGKTYVGTDAALRKALPFLYPIRLNLVYPEPPKDES
jgi:hypothetical protein